jgi:hypothetical protein
MAIVQRLHEGGGSWRGLLRALGLPRSSVQRWQSRLRRGLPAVGRPGPARRQDVPLLLDAQIAALSAGARRTRHTGRLWRHWRTLISRRDFTRHVAERRRQAAHARRLATRRLCWPVSGAVWATDAAQFGGQVWNLVCDLGSRFRFDLLLAPDLPASRVAGQLRRLFDRYGAPLVLKRDNGSNLACREVDAVLNTYGVIDLTSPVHYPAYNGGVEYAQREIKTVAAALVDRTGEPLDRALREAPDWLNAAPRPCLGGASAGELFNACQPQLQARVTTNDRKEAKRWILERTCTILSRMEKCSRRTIRAARRHATEEWMISVGLVADAGTNKVLPLSSA